MAALGAEIIRWGNCYEDAVEASQQFARATRAFDANPVGLAGQIAIREYGAIVNELAAQCPIRLGSIWLPVGNGTCTAGVHRMLRKRRLDTAICVVGSIGNTALTASLAVGHVVELDRKHLKQTPLNEPLLNWASLHVHEAMEAVLQTGGHSCDATDAELLLARAILLEDGVHATAAGAAGLVGLAAFSHRLDHAAAHVVILTA
jgi:threonine dehydratase